MMKLRKLILPDRLQQQRQRDTSQTTTYTKGQNRNY